MMLDPFLLLAGQYIGFRLTLPSGDKIERDYSLSDSAHGSSDKPTHYRVTIKRVPGGVGSDYFHERVQEGMQIEVGTQAGRHAGRQAGSGVNEGRHAWTKGLQPSR
jgi:ferredoxin-NADP reductase